MTLDELIKFLCSVGKLNLPSDSLKENVDPVAEHKENSKNNKIEESQLNDQEEYVNDDQHQDELDETHDQVEVAWASSLSWLVLDVSLQLLSGVLVGVEQLLVFEDELHSNFVVWVEVIFDFLELAIVFSAAGSFSLFSQVDHDLRSG